MVEAEKPLKRPLIEEKGGTPDACDGREGTGTPCETDDNIPIAACGLAGTRRSR
jgi:hypothetical protein